MVPDLEDFFGFTAQPFKRMGAFFVALCVGGVIGYLATFLSDCSGPGVFGLMFGGFVIVLPIFVCLMVAVVCSWKLPWTLFASTAVMALAISAGGGKLSTLLALVMLGATGRGLAKFLSYQQARWLAQIEELQAENAHRREELKRRGIATYDPEPAN